MIMKILTFWFFVLLILFGGYIVMRESEVPHRLVIDVRNNQYKNRFCIEHGFYDDGRLCWYEYWLINEEIK
jgi:hypothetical protein